MSKSLEGILQLQILKYLRFLGAVAGKTKTMGVRRGSTFCYDFYTFRGFPDITCFWNSSLYFIEVKSPKGKQTPEQENFQLLCSQIPSVHYILAKKLEDITEIIK